MRPLLRLFLYLLACLGACLTESQATTIDNSSLEQANFREHKATYGLVYLLPRNVIEVLDRQVYVPLREALFNAGLKNEVRTFNLPHVTIVHIHSSDPMTPQKMLKLLPRIPPVINLTLKNFYTTEAAKGAVAPWWFDLGVVKSGQGFREMMSYNTVATAALTPLRDGPLPRCTGPVFVRMNDGDRELIRTVGVSGVNVIKDGKETASHNPHSTLVYSMTPYDSWLHVRMKDVADKMNRTLPKGIATQFKEVSIVEIGFMGNVLREFYRINLEDGSAWDVSNGKAVSFGLSNIKESVLGTRQSDQKVK